MSADAWVTLATMIAMTVVLARGLVSAPAAVVGATAFVYAAGVIDTPDALAGLSNPAPVAVAGLYVIAGAVSKADLVGPVVDRLVGSGQSRRWSLARLLVPSAGASAFLANTPIVAMLIPAIVRWGDRRRVSPSRYLLPLSFATILGGALTVVGTSTNLVASGLSAESGMGELSLFDPAKVALPVVVVGLILIVVLAPLLIPDRRAPRLDDPHERPFTVVMTVANDGRLSGSTVEEAGLRSLDGVYLVEIEREGSVVSPVAPGRRLDPGDRLVFVGDIDNVVDLHHFAGLESATGDLRLDEGEFYEVVVGQSSSLVGNTLRDARFRSKHHAAVVAIHRSGTRIESKLGEVAIHVGDTLLLRVGPDFEAEAATVRDDFVVCTALSATRPQRATLLNTAVTIAAVSLVAILPAFGIASVLRSVTLAGGVLIIGGAVGPSEAWNMIDLRIVAMIAGALGLGRAVAVSGLGDELAGRIIDLTSSMGDLGAVIGVLLATMLLNQMITNVAAVALIFPTALTVAASTDVDPHRMILGVAVAASASFLTPIGYQTNTMVWGPGRYRMSDYAKLGAPLWLVTLIGTGIIVTLG